MHNNEWECSLKTSLNLNDDEKAMNDDLLMKLVQTLPNISGISPDMLRSLAGQESEIISNQMYASHISYLRWKQCRKANESIPDLIRLSIHNIKPIIK